MNFFVNTSSIVVTETKDDAVIKLGSCADSCCNTNVVVKGVTQPVIFENAPGKGGFIAKKLYLEEFIKAFKMVLNSDVVKEKLSKFPITITRLELENGSYINKLS